MAGFLTDKGKGEVNELERLKKNTQDQLNRLVQEVNRYKI